MVTKPVIPSEMGVNPIGCHGGCQDFVGVYPKDVNETTQRSWCGLCGTYVYVGDPFPCAELRGGPPKEPCGVVGATLETINKPEVIPLSTEGVAELLGRTQGDPGDEISYSTSHEDDECECYDCGRTVPDDPEPETDIKTSPKDIKQEIANEALSIVNGARRSAYGTPERNFGKIADFWNTYLKQRFPDFFRYYEGFYDQMIQPRDVPAMMRFVKEARLIETPDHKDSFTDLLGYALCQAEISGAK